MEVRPVTVEEAVTLAFEPEAFTARFGGRLVAGWDVPGVLDATVEALEAGIDPSWLTHLIVEPAPDGTEEVVGMGGFTGPPRRGEVELGYQVAPSRRGRGIAAAAVELWLARARAAGLSRVVARTAPGPHASATTLTRCGFVRDPLREQGADAGPHWWWVRCPP